MVSAIKKNIFIIFVALSFAGVGLAQPQGGDVPFSPGERLTFVLKWGFITAGKATLEVHPMETVNGVESYHFVMTAKSRSFLDNIYKVRDRIDAYADVGMNRSMLYKKKQREGKTRRDVLVEFDWEKPEVQYSNFGDKRDPIPLEPGSFDPLSAFYFTRMIDLEKVKTVERPVTDGKKCVIGKASVVKRETIKLTDGTEYDTFLIEPELQHIGGVFEKSKDAKIRVWVTADKRRIPVKITSKVIVGSFVGELESAEFAPE